MSLLGIVVASLFVSSVRGDAPATLFNRIVYAAGTTYTVNVATNGNVTLGPAKTYGAVAYVLFPDFTYVQLYRLDWDLAQNSGGWAATDVGAWEYVRANQFAGVLRLRPTGAAIIEHSLSFETDRSGAINSPARSGQIFAFWLGDRASFGPVVNAPPLVNASLRAAVNPSGQAIAGFVVSGKSPRAVLVRAVGPGLALFGVTSPLADPKLNVPALTTPLTRNDNWAAGGSADLATMRRMEVMVGAFPLAAGSTDAALLLPEVAPGAYTVVVDSVQPSGSGEVLIEVYVLP